MTPIPDAEWVVNWGVCHECFNRDYDEYVRSQAGREVTEDGDPGI